MRSWLVGPWLLASALWANVSLAHSAAVLRGARADAQTVEVATRLRGELLSMNIDASSRIAADTLARSPVQEREALLRQVTVAMDVTSTETELQVTIWLWQRAEVTRWLTLSEHRDAPNAAEKLAIRAAEALHSRSVEPAPEVPPPEARPLPTAPQPQPERTSERDAHLGGPQLELGAVLFKPAVGLSASLLPLLRLEWALSSSIDVQASVAALGGDNHVESELGGARVSNHYGTVGVDYFPVTWGGVRPFVGISTGALLTHIQGQADAPLRTHREQSLVWLWQFSIGSRVVLSPRYFVTLAGHVHFTQPTLSIHVVDRVVAVEGRPNWVASLTAGARL